MGAPPRFMPIGRGWGWTPSLSFAYLDVFAFQHVSVPMSIYSVLQWNRKYIDMVMVQNKELNSQNIWNGTTSEQTDFASLGVFSFGLTLFGIQSSRCLKVVVQAHSVLQWKNISAVKFFDARCDSYRWERKYFRWNISARCAWNYAN